MQGCLAIRLAGIQKKAQHAQERGNVKLFGYGSKIHNDSYAITNLKFFFKIKYLLLTFLKKTGTNQVAL